MLTIRLILLSTTGHPPSEHTVSVYAMPAAGEFVVVAGIMYRVTDVTHHIEANEIEVRCVA